MTKDGGQNNENGRYNHNDRPDVLGEHHLGDMAQLVLFILFIAVWALDGFFLGVTRFTPEWLPLYARLVAGGTVVAVSIVLAKRSHDEVFGPVRPRKIIIDTGPFSRVRHPLYLSVILFYLGLLIVLPSGAAAVVLVVTAVFYDYIAGYEERLMLGHFGGEYEDYRKRTPKWIPRITGHER